MFSVLKNILFSLEEIMSSRVSKIDRSLVDSLTASIFWMLNYENTSYPWRTQTIGKHWRPRVWRVSWRIDHAQATCFLLIRRNSPWPFHKLVCIENDKRSWNIFIYNNLLKTVLEVSFERIHQLLQEDKIYLV